MSKIVNLAQVRKNLAEGLKENTEQETKPFDPVGYMENLQVVADGFATLGAHHKCQAFYANIELVDFILRTVFWQEFEEEKASE